MNTREFLTAIKVHNYPSMFGALFGSNGMLPDEYQVDISDEKYNDALKEQGLMVCCNHCQKEINHKDLQIKSILTTYSIAVLTGQSTEKVWECGSCNKINMLAQTRIYEKKAREPYYLQVVPKPPTRKGTLLDRSEYHKTVERWAWLFYTELEHQMSRFRLEYKPKSEDLDEDIEISGAEFES